MTKKTNALIKILISISMVASSLPAYSLDIRIDQNMFVRTQAGPYMKQVGKLTKGSVITIPDEVVVKNGDKVDLSATFKKWEAKSYYYTTTKKEKFYPIKIKSAAAGSTPANVDSLKSVNMALDFLERRGNATPLDFVVKKDAPVFETRVPTAVSDKAVKTEGGADCINCGNSTTTPPTSVPAKTKNDIKQVTEAAPSSSPEDSSDPIDGYQGFDSGKPECQKFIDRNGNIGPYGEMVLSEIDSRINFRDAGSALKAVCPAYEQWNRDGKYNEMKFFWAWIFASMASAESGCQTTAKARGPNGPAVGLFQLEGNKSEQNNRDDLYDGDYCTADMKDPASNIKCAVATMNYFTVQGNRTLLRDYDQYWQVLMPSRGGKNYRTTSKLIKSFKPCQQGGN